MRLSEGDLAGNNHWFLHSKHDKHDTHDTRDTRANRRTDAPPREQARLAIILIEELSACLQMIASDLAQPTGDIDLEEASLRWGQRLMAVAAFIEQTIFSESGRQRTPRSSQQDATTSGPLDATDVLSVVGNKNGVARSGRSAYPDVAAVLPHAVR